MDNNIISIYKNDLPDNVMLSGDLAIDTETMGLNLQRDRLCVLQITNGDNNVYLIQFTDDNYDAPNLKRLLRDKTRLKIFHYARFDLAAIDKYLDVKLDNIFCTKIASRLVRTYTDYHGLKDLCKELLSINISKQQQSSYWNAEILTEEQQEYAAKDVIYLHQIRDILNQRLVTLNRDKIASKIFDFLPTRVELDLMGWCDVDIFSHSVNAR